MINDGGPAFPLPNCSWEDAGGMSLRDYFAAKTFALGGEFFHNIDDRSDPPNAAEHCASVAYAIADAMLAERAKVR